MAVHRKGNRGDWRQERAGRAAGAALLVLAAFAAEGTAGEASHEQGRRIYNFRCYFCHGYSGDARTLASTFIAPTPRDFTAADPAELSRDRMIRSVTEGRPGTAMGAFAGTLSAEEIAAVVDFVRGEFMLHGRENTRYHTVENGWPDHDRYRAAFPFATGELALDTPWESLTAEQQTGRRLFMSSCISCHDRARVEEEGLVWSSEAVSYPRLGFATGDFRKPPDAVTGASPYARHDVPPVLDGLDPEEREGERLYQENCAFCHAADGTGRNWIGAFLTPHPRDLTRAAAAGVTPERLREVIRTGVPGTSMPAWGGVLDEAQVQALVRYVTRAFLAPTAPVAEGAPP